jgi:hypothetical protein
MEFALSFPMRLALLIGTGLAAFVVLGSPARAAEVADCHPTKVVEAPCTVPTAPCPKAEGPCHR